MRIRSIHPPHLICAFSAPFFRPVLRIKDVPHRFVTAKGIACESEDAIEIFIFRLDELDTHFGLFLSFLILFFSFLTFFLKIGKKSREFLQIL